MAHTGACAGMNFNGYASTSFLITIVTQTAATNGFVWHVTATMPYDSHSCSTGDFSECLAGGLVQQRWRGECRLHGRLVPGRQFGLRRP